jgi:transcriptional regulator with XRE-family HTH domain
MSSGLQGKAARDQARRAKLDVNRTRAETDSDDLVALGVAIRAARQNAGLTLSELARESGVSNSFLSLVERGLSSPSLRTLHAIGRALGVGAHALLASTDAVAISLVRQTDARAFLRDEHDGVAERMLVTGRQKMIVFEIVAPPGSDSVEHVAHEGEEFIYILEGRLEVTLAGIRRDELGRGDTLYFPATIPHGWRVLGKRRARFILAGTPPSF